MKQRRSHRKIMTVDDDSSIYVRGLLRRQLKPSLRYLWCRRCGQDGDRVCDQNKVTDNVVRERERIHGYEWERDRDLDKDMLRPNNHHKFAERDKDQMPKLLERSYSDRYGTRDCSSEAGNDDHVGVEPRTLGLQNMEIQSAQNSF